MANQEFKYGPGFTFVFKGQTLTVVERYTGKKEYATVNGEKVFITGKPTFKLSDGKIYTKNQLAHKLRASKKSQL